MKTSRKEKRDREQNLNMFSDVLKIIQHRFSGFSKWINSISDPRHQSYIKYDQELIMMVRILASCCHIESMRNMNCRFNSSNVIDNFSILFNKQFDELPHGDTINNYFKEVSVEQVKNVLTNMVKQLIKDRVCEEYRINGKYYQIVLDATQLNSYKVEHTPGSLVTHHANGNVSYHNNVLMAQLICGNMAVPVDFEWLENSETGYDKQDCELKAAKRLLKRLKKTYKRLNICISADALYLGEPIIEICRENNWKYMITYKEGVIKTADEYYQTAKEHNDTHRYNESDKEGKKNYEYYNEIEYRDYKINIVEMRLTDEEGKVTKFAYATNLNITENNYKKRIGEGRRRWKGENKGFNDLKNHGYNIKHAYSYNENAMKVHTVQQLISHLIMQLVEHYERTKGRFETIKELGYKIKEALRNKVLSAKDIRDINRPFQIRREISY